MSVRGATEFVEGFGSAGGQNNCFISTCVQLLVPNTRLRTRSNLDHDRWMVQIRQRGRSVFGPAPDLICASDATFSEIIRAVLGPGAPPVTLRIHCCPRGSARMDDGLVQEVKWGSGGPTVHAKWSGSHFVPLWATNDRAAARSFSDETEDLEGLDRAIRLSLQEASLRARAARQQRKARQEAEDAQLARALYSQEAEDAQLARELYSLESWEEAQAWQKADDEAMALRLAAREESQARQEAEDAALARSLVGQ